MKSLRIITVILLPVVALFLGFGLGSSYQTHQLAIERGKIQDLFTQTGSGKVIDGDPEQTVDISLLWSVWRLLQKHYLMPDALTADTLVFGAVGGLVDAVGDPYTVFMTPKDTKSFQDSLSGTLEGIGAQLDLVEGEVTVVAPLKGSPAERAGLEPKDIITDVNGTNVSGMELDEVVKMIRGPKGTTVTLLFIRPPSQEKTEVTLTRENIHVPSVESKTIGTGADTIAVVTLNQFGDSSMQELRSALDAVAAQEVKGLVLDLRYNGGGYLEGAVDLVSFFVKSGTVVTVDRRADASEVHKVHGDPLLPDIPLAVLINQGSASASEIVAGALQDTKRATIIGQQSFGKGTVQEVLDLPGGSMLRVTVARWLTPAGHDLGKKGVTPDIVIDRTPEQFRQDQDPQLDAAKVWLLEQRVMEGATAGSGVITR
ncbi:MAG: S41 family peptidase [Candidatus Peribacteraceae bacterium]|nr:S41 family peptidase [Candidatus Peribacteraceae bacterium]